MVSLSADPELPTFHPDQVEALTARPDLSAVVASAVPLGPNQAAQRLRHPLRFKRLRMDVTAEEVREMVPRALPSCP
ncbi:hypothetical protein [Streptomyces sp. NPDC049949]|uniref:hypothetical protein n=1 Tax=Streptomyces sp. NPDC049949 TaxID=3154627 RepID=UPI0034380D58